MKLATNFINRANGVRKIILLCISCISLILVVFSVDIYIDTNAISESMPKYLELLRKLEEKNQAKASGKYLMPSRKDIDLLAKKVGVFNKIGKSKSRSMLSNLLLLEHDLPTDAYVVMIAHKMKEGTIHLTAESRSLTPLNHFLENLEKNKAYRQVLLVKQTQKNNKKAPLFQFELELAESKRGG